MNNVLRTMISILLLSASVAFSGTMGSGPVDWIHNGFYIAGDIGPAGFADKEYHSSSPESHQLGSVGIIGGGYVGYNYGINSVWGLALELFADATGFNAAITHQPNTYHHSQDYDLGVRVLPEYAFTPATTGHLILGYTNGRFHISDNGVYGYIDTGYNKSGFQGGLGFTTAMTDHVFVRLDAIYDIYASQTNTGLGLSAGTWQFYTNTYSTLAGEFSLIYQFS